MIATRTGREDGRRIVQDFRDRLIAGLPVTERLLEVRGPDRGARRRRGHTDPVTARRCVRSCGNVGIPAILPAKLERMGVPVDLIWGRHDRALRLSIAESASERYGWPLHVIEDTADHAPLEQPAAFLDALWHAMRETAAVSKDPAKDKGGT